MLPPTDSLRHLASKLAEVRANRTAPPPYNSVPRAGIDAGILSDIDLGEVENPTSPITITIDASIHVQGDGNTLLLGTGNKNPEQQQQQNQNQNTSPNATPPTTTGRLQSAQTQRQAKLTEMATTIIAALRDSDMLIDESGRSRPIAVNIHSGVKVEGCKNVVCMGSGIARIARRDGGAATSPTEEKEKEKEDEKKDGDGEEGSTGRKRAQSVCLFPVTVQSTYVLYGC